MTETLSQDSLKRAAELILQADALIVTAGVGMGGLADATAKPTGHRVG